MHRLFAAVAAVLLVGFFAAGCAGPEKKLGRGMRNFYEVVRGSEMRATIEETGVFESPAEAYSTGLIKGFNRRMARTGIGIYEILTCPFPPYGPVCTNYLSPNPAYPDSYQPGLPASPTFATDSIIGFSGGDVAPMVPGSRFRVFDR